MQAAVLERFGGPEELVVTDLPDPEVGPDDVLVDVAHASITFVETQTRSGRGPFSPTLPIVPGNGVGGVVVAVGSVVDAGLVGRRVVTTTGGSGGYASLAVVPAAGLIDVPDALALDVATALLADGRTATWLLDAAPVSPGSVVLVEAAAGGVGSLLVQLAAGAGATVVAAAGGDDKLRLARELGAHHTVDYRAAGWDDEVRAAVGNVDIVFDGVGGDVAATAFGLVGRGGLFLPYGMAGGSFAEIDAGRAADRDVTVVSPTRPTPEETSQLTRRALGAAAEGRVRTVIGQRYPLADVALAHAAIESRATIGKTLLDV